MAIHWALERLENERLDILVIGGGVVGAGAALDAATRGLRVGLVEARGRIHQWHRAGKERLPYISNM